MGSWRRRVAADGWGLRLGFWSGCFLRGEKEKLRSWTVVGPRTERRGLRENPYETVGKVEVFPAQAGMSPRLNEGPYKAAGKSRHLASELLSSLNLNESPSKKERKFPAPHKTRRTPACLNESPSKKEGKYRYPSSSPPGLTCLNESPCEKVGKWFRSAGSTRHLRASMKALPKRKGNPGEASPRSWTSSGLNESPYEKAGK